MTPAQRRQRLVKIGQSLPEVTISGNQHLAFRVRNKTLAYYQNDHHGDGMVSLVCKAMPGAQELAVGHDPTRFFVPGYLGTRGWLGLRLDLRTVNWRQIEALLVTAYRLTATKALVALLPRNRGGDGVFSIL